ncbi:MAG: ArnT family glycosyltransferase [Planctomycetota bacterium]|jgi:4-amino-4-deoxy-L-arabinose transferase-like glycosyltransferase
MSRRPKKNRIPGKPPKSDVKKITAPADRKSRKEIAALLIIAILAAIPFSMGKYFELNFPDPYDSGGFAYSAAHILAGARIGIDERPSAELGTLLVNMFGVRLFGFSETGPKLMQMLFQAGALVLMFAAMRKLFGILAAAVGVVIASTYLSAPLIAKFGNVKEQYMIACMVMGVSCLVLRQLDGKWWWAVLAGAFVSWAPLFKPTGTSAIGAMGLFVLAQPFFKHRTWKQTGIDILLLLAGVVAAIGPLYVWIIGWDVQTTLPYSFAWRTLGKMLPAKAAADASAPAPDYVAGSRKLVTFAEQWPRVLRFYNLLILPIALAIAAIGARIVRMAGSVVSPEKTESKTYDRFVLLLAVWWILDMAFVWISPRSYEQYYLPLTASAAMLGGYLIAVYRDRFLRKPRALTTPATSTRDIIVLAVWAIAAWVVVRLVFSAAIQRADRYEQYRVALSAAVIMLGLGLVGLVQDRLSNGISSLRWSLAGVIGLVCMAVMSWHIFFGIRTSAHTGQPYGDARNGYDQKLDQISRRRKQNAKMDFERVGEYIRLHSAPTDKMYVWGWYPGIYVSAQRFSAAAKPVMMPRPAPALLGENISGLLAEFERQPPKFIVDSRKLHIPTNRPPYELWPIAPKGLLRGANRTWFLPANDNVVAMYDKFWTDDLRKRYGDDEADRYVALAPLRKFVMDNYEIVEPRQYVTIRGWPWLVHRMFDTKVVFRLKSPAMSEEPR